MSETESARSDMPQDDFDLAAFQKKVLEELKTLQGLVKVKETLAGLTPEADAQINRSMGQFLAPIAKSMSAIFSESILHKMREAKKIDGRTLEAREFLKRPGTRSLLCPVLRPVEENLSRLAHRSIELDSAEVATVITPVLSSPLYATAITIPRHPLTYALCAWMIARTGLARYCAATTTDKAD